MHSGMYTKVIQNQSFLWIIFLKNGIIKIKYRFINLIKILNECEFKRTIEHLFSHEYSKYFSYKKLKLKNNFTVYYFL